jgi:tetratricopeptide (TPR) repeat protein
MKSAGVVGCFALKRAPAFFPLLALIWLSGCETGWKETASVPTFSHDVAPLIFENCARCHRPSGSAPFALLSYSDVRPRARRIVELTASRTMPPWLPAAGHGEFIGERRLSISQIDVLKRWVAAGSKEGDPRELPSPPPSLAGDEGWELGTPGLVLEMAEPFDLPAMGPDVFRNFVIPVPLHEPHYVDGFELRPSDGRLVHHATITIDESRASRRMDAADPGPGFEGMRAAPGAVMPDGYFLGWTPGKSPHREPAGMSWKLEANSDLVVQLHMPTTGKPEKVRVKIGLYFTDTAPRAVPVTIRLGSRYFEIPAGERNFLLEDDYVLPADVSLLSIYPHAHYLARRMEAKAALPDGTEKWLIDIPEWNFHWQDFYRYRDPVALPKGTRLTMRFTYDNSDDNPRNPNHPARRVTYGPKSADEMGDLYLQLLPQSTEALERLREDWTENELDSRARELTFQLERAGDDPNLLNSLGVVHARLGRTGEALRFLREAIRLDPDHRDGNLNLGTLLAAEGSRDEAARRFEISIQSDPSCVDCRVRLGNVLRESGNLDGAVRELAKAVELDPDYGWSHYSLGIAFQSRGLVDRAISEYREEVRIEPRNADARVSLGSALTARGGCAAAVSELEAAARLEPEWAEPPSRLAWALTTCPIPAPDRAARAVAYGRRAAELSHFEDPYALDNLAAALALAGETVEARATWERARELAEQTGNGRLAAELREKILSLPDDPL